MVCNPLRGCSVIFYVFKDIGSDNHIVGLVAVKWDGLIENLSNDGNLSQCVQANRIDLDYIDFTELTDGLNILSNAGTQIEYFQITAITKRFFYQCGY